VVYYNALKMSVKYMVILDALLPSVAEALAKAASLPFY
jgi:hypothetical protein